MAKYNKKIVDRICSLIESDSFTIAEICSNVGIAISTYYEWIETKSEFSEAIEKAKKQFDEILAKEAKNSLRKLVNGYDVEEVKTIYVESKEIGEDGRPKPKIKEKAITKKHFQPNPTMVIFALTNKAQDEYKNRQNSEVTGKDGKDLIPARTLTKEEARELLNSLDNDC